MSFSLGKVTCSWISGFGISLGPEAFSSGSSSPEFMSLPQLIQTVSAVDRDDPRDGQRFYYSLAPEAANNPNFTLRDNQGNQVDVGYRHLSTVWAAYLGLSHSVSKPTCPLLAGETLVLIRRVSQSFFRTLETKDVPCSFWNLPSVSSHRFESWLRPGHCVRHAGKNLPSPQRWQPCLYVP